MKIKFLANTPLGNVNLKQSGDNFACSINMAYFFIKHFYELHGKNPDVEWLLGELIIFDTIDTIVDNIIHEQPDILALSVFIWNESFQHEISQRVKQQLPNTVIVMGGPQLTAHKDSKFFIQHPYVDYVVYGDGERAFQQIVDYVSGYTTNTDHFVNIVTRDAIYPFEQLTDPEYFSTSPYLNQQEFIRKHIDYLDQRGVPRSHMMIGIEFARGCMYNCSFCDWSQNLTKKVKRRRSNWREELMFFKNLDVSLRDTDANFGQYSEDIEIYDYAVSLYDPSKNFKFIAWNTPKLKKEPAYHILKTNAEVYGTKMIITLQDINEDVLTKMDRPSLSWEDHKIMIKKLKETCKVDTTNILYTQLMLGVAGQSYDSICETMYKIWTEAGVYRYVLSHWLLLPNSPGADILYQKLHQLKWIPSYVVNVGRSIQQYKTLDEIYDNVANLNGDLRVAMQESTAIYSTATMTLPDIMAAQILMAELHRLREKFNPEKIKSFDQVFAKLKASSLQEACKQFDIMQPLIEKHGFVILGSFNPETHILAHHFDRARHVHVK